jgi:hypothetical protein
MTNTPVKTVQRCKWAESTLLLPMPYWFDAWNAPWSCWAEDGRPRLIESTEVCASCARWTPKDSKTDVR